MTLLELKDILHKEKCSCVIACGEEIHYFHQRGVKDLYDLLTTHPDVLVDAMIADKVVGKGAAALMILGGVAEVYADVISEPALKLLENNGLKPLYKTLVSNIINRAGTGPCPVESLCHECDTAEECLPRIESFIKKQ